MSHSLVKVSPRLRRIAAGSLFLWTLGACSSGADTTDGPKADAEYGSEAASGMHAALEADVKALAAAAEKIQAAAPSPTNRGWDPAADAAALEAMKKAWIEARGAYERIEGAIAPLFPEIDFAIDARYEDFLQENGPDDNLFDGTGVTGMHAVERILFASTTPEHIVAFEKASVPGSKPAAYPSTATEAKQFKEELCAQLVRDTKRLAAEWSPVKIDVAGAYQGLVDLVNEQAEKVNKASTQEEESRYAQRTLADLRDNLEGVVHAYAVFRPWVEARSKGEIDGKALNGKIDEGFERLRKLYGALPGDAMPQPPSTWSAASPSVEDRASPFGKLYTGVQAETDVNDPTSLVSHLNEVGELLGLTGTAGGAAAGGGTK